MAARQSRPVVVVVVVFFFILHLQSVSVSYIDCLKPGLEERLFEAGCTVSRSSTTALPCLQLENSQHSELSNCWAWILNLLLPIMVLVSKGFVSWMMLFNAG